MIPTDTHTAALIRFAETGARLPRARRCWLLGHAWGLWEAEPGGRVQRRACVGCGRIQEASIGWACSHRWRVHESYKLTRGNNDAGRRHELECKRCGDLTSRSLWL